MAIETFRQWTQEFHDRLDHLIENGSFLAGGDDDGPSGGIDDTEMRDTLITIEELLEVQEDPSFVTGLRDIIDEMEEVVHGIDDDELIDLYRHLKTVGGVTFTDLKALPRQD
jgi:hypothetical protein